MQQGICITDLEAVYEQVLDRSLGFTSLYGMFDLRHIR
jgi:hypothetical protein